MLFGQQRSVMVLHDFFLVGRLMKGSTAWELFYSLSHANERHEEAREGYPMA